MRFHLTALLVVLAGSLLLAQEYTPGGSSAALSPVLAGAVTAGAGTPRPRQKGCNAALPTWSARPAPRT